MRYIRGMAFIAGQNGAHRLKGVLRMGISLSCLSRCFVAFVFQSFCALQGLTEAEVVVVEGKDSVPQVNMLQ
jgi:hypothetical protein